MASNLMQTALHAREATYNTELGHINRQITYNTMLGSTSTAYWVCDKDPDMTKFITDHLRERGFRVKVLQNPYWWNSYASKLEISW